MRQLQERLRPAQVRQQEHCLHWSRDALQFVA
jgi:hypothetical protein